MKEITVQELKQKMDANENFQLIDVREEHEYENANISGATLMPLASFLANAASIQKDIPVIIHCRSGSRSAAAILSLEKEHGHTNLYNLKGGIMAYSREIDTSLQVQ